MVVVPSELDVVVFKGGTPNFGARGVDLRTRKGKPKPSHVLRLVNMSKEVYTPPPASNREAYTPPTTGSGTAQPFTASIPRAPVTISYLCAGNPMSRTFADE